VKNTTLNNFLTVPPILTIVIPINSGQQAEKCGIIKKFHISRWGSNRGYFWEKYPPKGTSQPMN
jgi:hypothetical protein